MQILPDIPVESQLAIHAEVMRIAERHNLPFGKAFYVLMKRYRQALVISELERVSIDGAIEKLNRYGYWEKLGQ